MDTLIQPNISSPTEPQASSLRPILAGIVIVVIVVGIFALIFRAEQKKPAPPPAYAANLKFSDLKTSAAQNFIEATVTYLDGTITNTGNKTVVHAVAEVTFKDDMGLMAQRDEHPIRVLISDGPYDEAVDLKLSPLGPGQSKTFRLTFENISAQWNHAYPDLRIIDVTVK